MSAHGDDGMSLRRGATRYGYRLQLSASTYRDPSDPKLATARKARSLSVPHVPSQSILASR